MRRAEVVGSYRPGADVAVTLVAEARAVAEDVEGTPVPGEEQRCLRPAFLGVLTAILRPSVDPREGSEAAVVAHRLHLRDAFAQGPRAVRGSG
jgi:hypothetical protein